jgi:hypothetical protein
MRMRATIFFVLFLLAVGFAFAVPTGTDPLNIIKSEKLDTWGPQNIEAEAGNVTQFDVNASSVTRTWQGYFGNITGRIVLGDAANNTIYDWNVANPKGEIYAVRSVTVPAWFDVRCSTSGEVDAEDAALNVNRTLGADDKDAVNNTFLDTASAGPGHAPFYTADQSIAQDSCYAAWMHDNTYQASINFEEVLLSDAATVPIIYTGIIAHTINPNAESTGFDGATHDFEMLVGEDGHGTNVATSTYYFYVELN